MPNGTIQDSRNPTSPQFGYLRMRNSDLPGYGAHAANKDPFNEKELLDSGPGTPWNRFVIFINDNKDENGEFTRLERGDRVEFDMTHLDVVLDGTEGKIWVAKVTKKL
jgi:hypothetical protein